MKDEKPKAKANEELKDPSSAFCGCEEARDQPWAGTEGERIDTPCENEAKENLKREGGGGWERRRPSTATTKRAQDQITLPFGITRLARRTEPVSRKRFPEPAPSLASTASTTTPPKTQHGQAAHPTSRIAQPKGQQTPAHPYVFLPFRRAYTDPFLRD